MQNIATIKWLGYQTGQFKREQTGRCCLPIVLLATLVFSLFVPLLFALQPCAVSTPPLTSASHAYQQRSVAPIEATAAPVGSDQLIATLLPSSPADNNCPVIVRQSNSPDASLVQSSYQVILFIASLLLPVWLIYRDTAAPPRKPRLVYLQPPLPPPIPHS